MYSWITLLYRRNEHRVYKPCFNFLKKGEKLKSQNYLIFFFFTEMFTAHIQSEYTKRPHKAADCASDDNIFVIIIIAF